MKVIFSDAQLQHFPQTFFSSGAATPNPEVPERATRLLQAALSIGLDPEEPTDYGLDWVSNVHTPRYLHYFENIFTRWSRIEGGSAEVVPGIQPGSRDGGYPASAAGQGS